MAEFIDRKALREAFDNADAYVVEEYADGACDWGFGRQNILEVINSVPAADVAPVRHGRWIDRIDTDTPMRECSVCGARVVKGLYEYENPNCYCYRCGARMDGDTNG